MGSRWPFTSSVESDATGGLSGASLSFIRLGNIWMDLPVESDDLCVCVCKCVCVCGGGRQPGSVTCILRIYCATPNRSFQTFIKYESERDGRHVCVLSGSTGKIGRASCRERV